MSILATFKAIGVNSCFQGVVLAFSIDFGVEWITLSGLEWITLCSLFSTFLCLSPNLAETVNQPKKHVFRLDNCSSSMAFFKSSLSRSTVITSVLVNLWSVFLSLSFFFRSSHLLIYWLRTYKMYDFEFEIEQVLFLLSPWLVSPAFSKFLSRQNPFLSGALHTSFFKKGVENALKKVKLFSDEF